MSSDKHIRNILWLMALVTVLAIVVAINAENKQPHVTFNKTVQQEESPFLAEVVNGIHEPTGLIADRNFELIITHCTACHGPDLVTQNRLSADGWLKTIRWMQEKQNLWDLGKDEKAIIAYLAKNYAPEETGRRKPLNIKSDEWYVLEN